MTGTSGTVTLATTTGGQYARILGVGGYRPSRVVTNAEVIETIESSDEWIRQRSGIQTRHMAAEDETVVDLSVAAAEKALANSGVTADMIGCVIDQG